MKTLNCCIFMFVVAWTLGLSALTLEQHFIFDLKGGCRVTYIYTAPEDDLGMIRGAAKAANSADCFDTQAVRRQFEAVPGVTVVSCNLFRKGTEVMSQVIVDAADAKAAIATGCFGDYMMVPSVDMPGDMEFTAVMPDTTKLSSELIKLMGGMKMTLRINTPTAILNTTGTKTAFNQTTWIISPDKTIPKIHARW